MSSSNKKTEALQRNCELPTSQQMRDVYVPIKEKQWHQYVDFVEYGASFGGVKAGRNSLRCKSCQKVFTGGMSRFLEHIAGPPQGASKNVKKCPNPSSKALAWAGKERQRREGVSDGESLMKRQKVRTSTTEPAAVPGLFTKDDADVVLVHWMKSTGVPHSAVQNPLFKAFCALVSGGRYTGPQEGNSGAYTSMAEILGDSEPSSNDLREV
mmetsp:Transcript_25386/g.41248  ORF Transcript_25386/g.41248 Transcript_25386/m.41248 type:complete len:211 (-) Transcript_25386:183-815(-)